ncbi:MAG: hypothetical protein HYV95_15160 [Opitutae bacterium]|nr:hypothetical protein [Opitutae bacterium]
MKLSKKLTLATAALIGATVALAQQGSGTASGVLGTSHLDVGYALTDIENVSSNIHAAKLAVNVPLTAHYDLKLGYRYSWWNDLGLARINAHTFSADSVFYTTTHGVKPYALVGVGYSALSASAADITVSEDSGIWNLGVGVEIPAGPVTFTPHAQYTDSFKKNTDGQSLYGVDANWWFRSGVGAYADVSYLDPKATADSSWIYSVGFRVKF